MQETADCKYCRERGKTWNGADPKCGFATGTFTAENWCCAALSELREIAEEQVFPSDDYNGKRWRVNDVSFAIVPAFNADDDLFGYIALSWYKDRGKCGQAYIFYDDDTPKPLTLKQVEMAIDYYRAVRGNYKQIISDALGPTPPAASK